MPEVHEWEQIDQGEAYCLHCPAVRGNEFMSAHLDIKTELPRVRSVPAQPKPVDSGTVRKDAEIESIKRTLYNAIDKLDKLTTK